jgi:hypothetical protein
LSRLRNVWPYAVVVAAPLLLLAPFLLGLRVLYWGTVEFQFYPWQQLAAAALRAGHLPLWNPLLGNGAPLLANYQSAVLYPPNWLALLWPLDRAQPWLAALHLAWAGVGMVALARMLGLPPLGQVVAGLAFGLSQYLVARVSFISINATAAWLPWIICQAEYQLQLGERGAARYRRAWGALLMTLCMALQLLAGHAQTAWYTLLLAGAWCGWRLLSRGRSAASARLRTAIWLVVPVALAALLAGVQLAPTAELLQQSPRATSAAFDFVMTYSFSPWRLLTMAAPDLLGNPARGQFFGYGNYWEDAIYVGLLPLLLAAGVALRRLIELLRNFNKRRPTSRRPTVAPLREPEATAYDGLAGLPYFLLGLSVVSLILGLGQNTPVFPFLYWHVPTFNLFQAPARILIWLVFAVALLAGMGAAGWRAPQGWALYWTRLGAAGAVAMAAVGALAWIGISPATETGARVQTMGQALALAGLTSFGAALLSLMRPAGESRRWVALVVAFIVADLMLADYGLNPGAPADLYRQPAATAQAVRAALRGHRLMYFPDEEYMLKYNRFVSFKSFGAPDLAIGAREALLADVSASDGLASANNFDPLVSARYAGLMDVISATRSLSLLRLMDVAVIASSRALDLEPIAGSHAAGVIFYRVPGAPQRVWVVSAATTVPGASEALAAVSDPGFDPAGTLILEAGDALSGPIAPAGWPSTNALTIPVTLDRAGWLMVADTSYPGWVVTVDGQAAPVRHADYAFRAVRVPAGAHTVVFDYRPDSLTTGWVLTALGGALALGLGAWGLVWPRRGGHAPA